MYTRMLRYFTVAVLLAFSAVAHVGQFPSIHDTMAGIVDRLKTTFSPAGLANLTVQQVEAFLTDDERAALATAYLTFEINVPAVVSIMRDERLGEEPFWLRDFEFKPTGRRVKAGERVFDVFEKTFRAGPVGLGASSLSGRGEHYFVALRPINPQDRLEITNVYPGQHTLGTLEPGARPYSDSSMTLADVPEELRNQILLRGVRARTRDCQLINIFRFTPYPASDKPDHVVLTWSDDPKTTQTIQWRTSTAVKKGVVLYQRKADFNRFKPRGPMRVEAVTELLETPNVVNDPIIHRHTAILRDLEPNTTYIYSVGDDSEDRWTEFAEFTTAPDRIEPFSFIYMGDAQNGLERWGTLIQNAYLRRPDAAFYIMAGDLVDRGAERDDWDSLFQNAQGVYNNRQLVPALGNHEYQGGDAQLYLRHFALPETGPVGERAYAFTYSNALFVVLDSNRGVPEQAPWLEEQLANTGATWKFVVYHHPAYSSSPNRNNPQIRQYWSTLFDKYHVDLALQGHDHAYLRTYPMKGEQRAGSPAEGTIYIVSVSGTKFYEQGDFDYTEIGMTNLSTYQTLDIQISGDRLVYRAYDTEGNLRDDFIIEK